MNRLVELWRMPGGVGVAIAVVTIPLIILLPDSRLVVALVALCLYPVLDVPHILARPSWWRAAIIAGIVWFVVFVALTGIADSVRPLRDDSLVFLLPFMMYPIALAISGIVRLQGRLGGRARESDLRIVAVVCGWLVVVPFAVAMVPFLVEKITGNTRANTVLSGDGEVLSADAEQVSVRVAGKPESFRFGAETKFDFRGPGSNLVTGPAGPAWLKPGQRVALEYVYRRHEAQAERVNIWIDRKGCAGDAKWTTATQTAAPSAPAIASLTGSTWEGWLGSRDATGSRDNTTFEFLQDNRVAYRGSGGTADAHWRQNGATVLIEVNDCYAEYEGQIEGDEIKGQFSNEMGLRESWTARRKQDSGPATTPK